MRFLTGDFNYYRYVKNNPLIFIDPYGLYSSECFYRALNNADAFVQWTGGLIVGSDKSAAQKRWVGYGIVGVGTGIFFYGAALSGASVMIGEATILSSGAIKALGVGLGLGGTASFGIGTLGHQASNGVVSPSVTKGGKSTANEITESACDLGDFCD